MYVTFLHSEVNIIPYRLGTNGWPRPVIPMRTVSGRQNLRTSQNLWGKKRLKTSKSVFKSYVWSQENTEGVGLPVGKFSAMCAGE